MLLNWFLVISYSARPPGCPKDLTLVDGKIQYDDMYKYPRRSEPKLVGMIAFYDCHSGYLRDGEEKRVCKFNENSVKWQGPTPVCETRNLLFLY